MHAIPHLLQEELGQQQALEEFARQLTSLFQQSQADDTAPLHPFRKVKLLGPIPSPQNDAALQRGLGDSAS